MKNLEHVGIIVDGNGRWAKERGFARSIGHKMGAKNIEKIIKHISMHTKIKIISLFVFSTENFNRPKDEVLYLMNLFKEWFNKCSDLYNKYNIKVIFSGEDENLPNDVIICKNKLIDSTKNNDGLIVNFCLNYGGKREIVSASKKIAIDVNSGKLDVNSLNEEIFSKYLYNNIDDIDLLIRTSGEQRISNFMLWSLAYSEFVFTKTYFPSFTCKEFDSIIKEYYSRDRRFGKV